MNAYSCSRSLNAEMILFDLILPTTFLYRKNGFLNRPNSGFRPFTIFSLSFHYISPFHYISLYSKFWYCKGMLSYSDLIISCFQKPSMVPYNLQNKVQTLEKGEVPFQPQPLFFPSPMLPTMCMVEWTTCPQ